MRRAPRRTPKKKTPAPEQTPLFAQPRFMQKSTDSRIIRAAKIYDKGTLTGGAADVLGSLTFQLNDLPEAASFTNLYDQYRVDRIDVEFVPLNRAVIAGTTALASGLLAVSVDYDDTGTPASLAVVLNYQNCKVTQAGRPFAISFEPHSASAAYVQAGTFTGYQNDARQWHDAASLTVLQFGLKYAITGSTYWPVWRVIARMHVSFKSPR